MLLLVGSNKKLDELQLLLVLRINLFLFLCCYFYARDIVLNYLSQSLSWYILANMVILLLIKKQNVLHSVWNRISKLHDPVILKRIDVQRLQVEMKLRIILKEQVQFGSFSSITSFIMALIANVELNKHRILPFFIHHLMFCV